MGYIRLFLTFLKIGLFSFGGGYAMLPFIQREIVDNNGWMDISEFLDIIAVSQMTPGPIAVNSSTYVGVKTLGIFGALVATLGVSIGSFILVVLIARKLEKVKKTHVLDRIFKGLRPAVLALILSSAVNVARVSLESYKEYILLILVLVGAIKYKIHPIKLIALSAIIGIFIY
ncbi:MAG: chromate transporter [Acidaminobacteraceae bacterium]